MKHTPLTIAIIAMLGGGFAVTGRRFDNGGGKGGQLGQLMLEALGKIVRLGCGAALGGGDRRMFVGHGGPGFPCRMQD